MMLQLRRGKDTGKATIGELYVDGVFECYTLEDTHHDVKIYGQTRIPEGSYEITLRNEGGMVKKYNDRFDNHHGMLWLRNVPNFEYVYIHVGNDADDTDGCILVGTGKAREMITGSVDAYTKLYPKVYSALKKGYPVNIEIVSLIQD